MENQKIILGLDFGTTASRISACEKGQAILIPNREGKSDTPSVVTFTATGEILIGRPAIEQKDVNHPERTIYAINQKLGSDWQITIDDKIYNAVDIAALILKRLREDAIYYFKSEVFDLVPLIPVDFRNQELAAFLEAIKNAGFINVERKLAKPIGAALMISGSGDKNILVYNLGGGSFNVAVLSLGYGVYEVCGVKGDAGISGEQIDNCIVEYLIQAFKKEHQIDLSKNAVARRRLKDSAEQAKIALGETNSVKIYIPFIHKGETGNLHLELELDISQFELLIDDLIKKTIEMCKYLIKEADSDRKHPLGAIHEVRLLGLNTQIPLIQKRIKEFFKDGVSLSYVPPQEAVLGAGILAGVLNGKVTDYLLLDVIRFSFGIALGDTSFGVIIAKNTTCPTRQSKVFKINPKRKDKVTFYILEGDDVTATKNELLGFLELPLSPDSATEIEITVDVDPNCVLHITLQAGDELIKKRMEFSSELQNRLYTIDFAQLPLA